MPKTLKTRGAVDNDWFKQPAKFNMVLTQHELRVLELWSQTHGRLSKADILRGYIAQLQNTLIEAKVLDKSCVGTQGLTPKQQQEFAEWCEIVKKNNGI